MFSLQNDYGYITGLVRALEARLLQGAQVERMIDAANATEAFTVLHDTDFAEKLTEDMTAKDFLSVIESSLLETKRRLNSSVPNDQVLQGLWMWYDFYNLKTAFKASVQNKSFEDIELLLSSFGSLDFAKVKSFAFGDESIEGFSAVKFKAQELFAKTSDTRYIDFVFDKTLFEKMLEWANQLKNSELELFVQRRIDIVNAQTFLRLTDDQRLTLGEDVFIAGGKMGTVSLRSTRDEGVSAIVSLLSGDEGVQEVTEAQSFQLLQKQSDDLLTKIIHTGRYASEGPLAVIGYWWARERAASAIRTIFVGKMNGVDAEIIRKHVNNLY